MWHGFLAIRLAHAQICPFCWTCLWVSKRRHLQWILRSGPPDFNRAYPGLLQCMMSINLGIRRWGPPYLHPPATNSVCFRHKKVVHGITSTTSGRSHGNVFCWSVSHRRSWSCIQRTHLAVISVYVFYWRTKWARPERKTLHISP